MVVVVVVVEADFSVKLEPQAEQFLSWTTKAYGNKFLQPVIVGSSQFEEEGG